MTLESLEAVTTEFIEDNAAAHACLMRVAALLGIDTNTGGEWPVVRLAMRIEQKLTPLRANQDALRSDERFQDAIGRALGRSKRR